jgi:hypothetical protein
MCRCCEPVALTEIKPTRARVFLAGTARVRTLDRNRERRRFFMQLGRWFFAIELTYDELRH